MNPSELVIDKAAFSVLARQCEQIFNTEKRLPDFVFRKSFVNYFAIEHAHIFKKEFASFLSKLSNIFKDKSVNYMTLDPHPINYYYRNLSFFGVASFEPSNLIQRYLPVMSREGNVESFRSRGGDVGVFWGSSLKWGIFCDRISWEMALIAVSENVDIKSISDFRCMDASWLLNYIESQYTKNPSIAMEFTQTLLANYPI